MAEAYLNGKPGKWRTVGGRRIFIAEGQSLKEAMVASGKFKNLKDVEHQKNKISNDITNNVYVGKERDDKWEEYDAFNEIEKDKKAEESKAYFSNDNEKPISYYPEPMFKPSAKEINRLKDEWLKANEEYEEITNKKAPRDWESPEYKEYYKQREIARAKTQETKGKLLEEYAKTIPYNEMFDTAVNISGVKNAKFTEPKIEVDNSGRVFVHYESNELKSQSGIFSGSLKSVKLKQFNSEVTIDENGELGYWGSMSIRYEHNDGGSNGMNVIDYTYGDKGWDITDSAGYKYKNGKKITTVTGLTDYYMEYYGYSKEKAKERAQAKMDYIKDRENGEW